MTCVVPRVCCVCNCVCIGVRACVCVCVCVVYVYGDAEYYSTKYVNSRDPILNLPVVIVQRQRPWQTVKQFICWRPPAVFVQGSIWISRGLSQTGRPNLTLRLADEFSCLVLDRETCMPHES